MKGPSITRSRRSTPSSTEGITLIELLIAIAVAGILLTAVLGLTLSSNRLFGADRARTEVNQNLRSVVEIIGNDIRVAGERLNSFSGSGTTTHPLAAIEVVDGRHLFVRRNLLDDVLPLCVGTLGVNQTTIQVSRLTEGDGVTFAANPECRLDDPTNDANDNDIPDALEAWQAYRAENGPIVGAFIYTASTDKSDLFQYSGDDLPPPSTSITRESGPLDNNYLIGERPVMILVEERHFRYVPDEGVLEMIINRDGANPIRLVNRVSDFQVRAIMRDGTVHENYVGRGTNWTQLMAVELSVTGMVQEGTRQVERTLTSRFFPRNVLSN